MCPPVFPASILTSSDRSPQSNPQSSQSFAGVSAISDQMTSGLTGPYAVSPGHTRLEPQWIATATPAPRSVNQGHGMLSIVGPAMERDVLGTYKKPQCPSPRERYERWSEKKSLRDAWSVVQWCAKRMISVTSSDVDEMTCMFAGVLASPRPRLLGLGVRGKCYSPWGGMRSDPLSPHT